MLQVSVIRENPEAIIRRLSIKHFDGSEIIPAVIALDDKPKETQKQLDDSLAQANAMAKEIGILYQTGKAEQANALKAKTAELKNLSRELGAGLESTKKELEELNKRAETVLEKGSKNMKEILSDIKKQLDVPRA